MFRTKKFIFFYLVCREISFLHICLACASHDSNKMSLHFTARQAPRPAFIFYDVAMEVMTAAA